MLSGKFSSERPSYIQPRIALCTKEKSKEFLEKLEKIGVFWHITLEPEDVFASPPQHEIIWIVGRRLKFELGFVRSFYLNTIGHDLKIPGKFVDYGWPNVVTFESCPLYLCIDLTKDPELLEGFVESARKMYNDSQNLHYGTEGFRQDDVR